jgi:prepilin-type N-terminal cleavage/methylation domain-containing protein
MTPWTSEKGFTLAELLVAFAVLSLALASVLTLQESGLRAYVTGSNRVEAQQNGRVALERMAREIREAQALTNQTPTQLTIQTDWNGNGVIGEAVAVAVDGVLRGEQVTYRLNGAVLERQEVGVDATFRTVIGGVEQLTLTYLPAPPNSKTVSITLRTRPENVPANSMADTRTQVTTTVRMRNS